MFFCHTGKELSFAPIKGSHVSSIYQSSLKEKPVDKIWGFQWSPSESLKETKWPWDKRESPQLG